MWLPAAQTRTRSLTSIEFNGVWAIWAFIRPWNAPECPWNAYSYARNPLSEYYACVLYYLATNISYLCYSCNSSPLTRGALTSSVPHLTLPRPTISFESLRGDTSTGNDTESHKLTRFQIRLQSYSISIFVTALTPPCLCFLFRSLELTNLSKPALTRSSLRAVLDKPQQLLGLQEISL